MEGDGSKRGEGGVGISIGQVSPRERAVRALRPHRNGDEDMLGIKVLVEGLHRRCEELLKKYYGTQEWEKSFRRKGLARRRWSNW